jgi:hypothetical protein
MKKINKTKSMNLLKEKRLEIVAVGRAVFTAMAYVETIRPVVEGYQREILAMMKAHIAPENIIRGREDEIILDPEKTYLMKDVDFQEYIDECHIEMQKHGFQVPERGHCPLLIAENLLRQAKQLLIEAMEPITGIKHEDLFHHGLTDYNNYVELTLKLVAGMASEKELNILR